MGDHGVMILGIPIPSSAPLFLALIAIHVLAGLTCVLAGLVAMLVHKGPGAHPRAGTIYLRALLIVFLSMAALSILRWPHDIHLFLLGSLSLTAGVLGRRAQRRRPPDYLRAHVRAMAASYILLLTAFYVDNGPNLPVWRALPHVSYWFIPALVGLPILSRVLRHHPLLRAGDH